MKIHFTASIEEDCMAYLDPLQIEQAVNNYMMNATRHTKPGRSVRLEPFFHRRQLLSLRI